MTVTITTTRTLIVVDPVAPAPTQSGGQRGLASLDGQQIGITGNGWASWIKLRDQLAGRFSTYTGAVARTWDIPLGVRADAATLDEIASNCDAVVLGLANCGSCSVATAANAAALMAGGTPVVAVATTRFTSLLTSLASGLPLVVLPAELEQMSDEELDAVMPALWDELVATLVQNNA